jgi:transposase
MELLCPHCCGLDVHKCSITACVRLQEKSGKPQKLVQRFGAITADLRALAHWLREQQVTRIGETVYAHLGPCLAGQKCART